MTREQRFGAAIAPRPSGNGGDDGYLDALDDHGASTSNEYRAAPEGLPGWLWPVCILLALTGPLTKNPLLTPTCFLVLPIMVSLLWRRGEPPILLAICLMQWLQVATPVLQ